MSAISRGAIEQDDFSGTEGAGCTEQATLSLSERVAERVGKRMQAGLSRSPRDVLMERMGIMDRAEFCKRLEMALGR